MGTVYYIVTKVLSLQEKCYSAMKQKTMHMHAIAGYVKAFEIRPSFFGNFTVALQVPRPLSQTDLEKVLATSRKTKVAASEYTGLRPQSSGWSGNREPDDYQVQSTISEISKLMLTQIMNLQSDAQDP